MKTRQQISLAVLAAASATCLLGGAANAQSTYKSDRNGNPVYGAGQGNNGRPGDRDRLSGSLSTRQQRVDAGSSVAFAYTVTNRGRDSQTYRFPSARMFDMEAVRVDVRANDRRLGSGNFGNSGSLSIDRGNDGRRVIWRYSDDQMFGQVLSEFTLRPGQTRSFLGKWQVDRRTASGTYEVTAFLTPQRDNRMAVSTTRIIVENGRGDGGNGGNGGGNGGNNGGNDRDVLDVTTLVRSNSSRYVDQRVTVRGVYRGSGNTDNSWLLDGDNILALVVTGRVPRNARLNDQVTVSGTLRRGRDKRFTLQADR